MLNNLVSCVPYFYISTISKFPFVSNFPPKIIFFSLILEANQECLNVIMVTVEERLPLRHTSDTMCEPILERNHTLVPMKDAAGILLHLVTYDITNVHTVAKEPSSANTQDATVCSLGQHT